MSTGDFYNFLGEHRDSKQMWLDDLRANEISSATSTLNLAWDGAWLHAAGSVDSVTKQSIPAISINTSMKAQGTERRYKTENSLVRAGKWEVLVKLSTVV